MIALKILCCIASFVTYLYCLYLYQLKGYFGGRYLKLIWKNKLIFFNLFMLIVSLVLNFSIIKIKIFNINFEINNISKINKNLYIILNITICLIYLSIFLHKLIKNKKIKFKITFRIYRNILIYSIFYVLLLFFDINIINFTFFQFLLIIFIDFLDFYKYFEKIYFGIKTKNYIKNHSQIIRIGITGSNGKTSIKNILNNFLKDEINTVITPQNFNTPKGIKYTVCKLCNQFTQCIIFEMGARKKNDIMSLCKLTNVNLGILSNVSNQHIETFKSIDNVFLTKTELPKYLNQHCCVFNYNDHYSLKAYKQKTGEKMLVGILNVLPKLKSKNNTKLKILLFKQNSASLKKLKNLYSKIPPIKFDLYAKNIVIKNGLTKFDLTYNHQHYFCETQLLGKHNISNILQALAIALYLKIDIKILLHKIATLQPVKHRLELIKAKINILDDSYNCSILSAKNSLEVLASFPNKKFCCTPGIIEGGAMQEKLNEDLAHLLKQNSDIQIIVGKTNRKAFQKVLNKKSAYFVDTLEDAKKLFSIIEPGDTLLLLNDLPDDYD